MADIHGEPMIVHVWRRALEADVGDVVVAADTQSIVDAVEAAGGRALLTNGDHASGSDRIYEALQRLDGDGRHDIVVNVQGDLPTIAPHVIQRALYPMDNQDVAVGTLVAPIKRDVERTESSVVKMVGTRVGPDHFRALYFTRATAPWGDGALYHHIGLYAWRREALDRFVRLPPSELEIREKLEQLRVLENGMRIDAVEVDDIPLGVDTQADLDRARAMLASRVDRAIPVA